MFFHRNPPLKNHNASHASRRLQRGQILIIVTFAFVGLMAFVGLVVDTGLTFIGYGKLRKAVDAAALGASSQYRKGSNPTTLEISALNFLKLNDINDPSARVTICDDTYPTYHDATLCTTPRRKLVKVIGTTRVNLAILPVIGIRQVTLSAEAVSEAASLDVVLVVDTSESMTFDAATDNPLRDPSVCNAVPGAMPGDCHPFSEVKHAAKAFVDQLYFPYDRVAVVYFAGRSYGLNGENLPLTDTANTVQTYVKNLFVYQAGGGIGPTGSEFCHDPPNSDINLGPIIPDDFSPRPPFPDLDPAMVAPTGVCRYYRYDQGSLSWVYNGFYCPLYYSTANPETCTTTNIGGGLRVAGSEFARPPIRQESLWVVILLSDGAANSSERQDDGTIFCPGSTHTSPFCRDSSVATRHCISAAYTHCIAAGGTIDPANYDADDYARDMADFVALENNALIFSIGLGPATQWDNKAGEELLKYAAETVGNGRYFFAPTGAQLQQIFLEIASNISTRLSH